MKMRIKKKERIFSQDVSSCIFNAIGVILWLLVIKSDLFSYFFKLFKY